jgi:hypothetical protein
MEDLCTIIARIAFEINPSDSHAIKMTCPVGCAGSIRVKSSQKRAIPGEH